MLKLKWVCVCMCANLIVAGEDGSSTAESVIPAHNTNAETPSEVYNINDS